MKKPFFIFVLLAGLSAIPVLAYAQDGFTPLTNLPGLTETLNADTIPNLLNQLYRLCIGAAAVIAVLQIMRAGTKFFFNTGSVSANQEGKRLITNSILGLLLVLSPAIVFGIINPDILDLSIDFRKLDLNEPASSSVTIPDDDRVRNSSCSDEYNPIIAQADNRQCDSVMGFVALPRSCYAGNEPSGTVLCGKPKQSSGEGGGGEGGGGF